MAAETDLWRSFVRAPMLRAFIPLGIGILVAPYTDVDVDFLFIAAIALSSVFLVVHLQRIPFQARWIPGGLLFLLLLAVGMLRNGIGTHPFEPVSSVEEPLRLRVRLMALTSPPKRIARFEAEVFADTERWDAPEATGKLLVSLALDSSQVPPSVGDIYWIETTVRAIDRIPDPGGFDRVQWAGSRGMTHEAYVPAEDRVLVGHTVKWSDHFAAMQLDLADILRKSPLREEDRGVVKALTLGSRDELSTDDRNSFARSGTMHVLAVSGMHVGLLYLLLGKLFSVFGKRRVGRWVRAVLLIAALACYAGITGASPSVLRATCMCFFFVIAMAWGRQSASVNSLFAAGFVMLIWDPVAIHQLSFQLSFLAVLGIVLFYRTLHDLWVPENWFLRQGWSIIAVSMAAQIGTMPLAMLTFKAFPTYFLPANIVVVSLIFITMASSIALLFLSAVPVVNELLGHGLGYLVQGMVRSAEFFGSLPGAYPAVRIDVWQCLLMYVVVACAGLWIIQRERKGAWLFGSSLLVFLVSWGLAARSTNAQAQFTVLDQRELVTVFQQGRSAVLFSDTTKASDPYRKRAIERYCRAMGVDTIGISMSLSEQGARAVHRNMVSGGGLFRTADLNILIGGSGSHHVEPPQDIDVLVIRSELDTTMLRMAGNAHVVLSPELDGLQRWHIRKRCTELGSRCHDVRRDGAFIFTRDT